MRSIRNIIEMQEFLGNQARRKAAIETDPVLKKAQEDAVNRYARAVQSFSERLETAKLTQSTAQGIFDEAEKKLKECKEKNQVPDSPPCDE